MNICLNPVIAIISCVLPVSSPKVPLDDAKLLQGAWAPVRWEFGGSAKPPSTIGSMKLTLTDGQYEFLEGPSLDAGGYAVRPDRKPKEMDIHGVKGPNAGHTIPAIYRFEHGRLDICYGLDGHRPKAFRSPKKSLVLLVVFSRTPSLKKLSQAINCSVNAYKCLYVMQSYLGEVSGIGKQGSTTMPSCAWSEAPSHRSH